MQACRRRFGIGFTILGCAALLWAASAWAQAPGAAQGPTGPAPDWTEAGTIQGLTSGMIQLKTAANEAWIVRIDPRNTKIIIDGTAETSFLRPGLNVRFTAEVDAKYAVTGDIKELEIYSPVNKKEIGLYTAGDPKPVRKPQAGNYEIKGKVKSYKGDQLVVSAGTKKIVGKLAPDATIAVHLSDLGVAQAGDAIKVTGWKDPPPHTARASELTVTLAKPLVNQKKSRSAKTAKGSKSSAPEVKDFGFGSQ